MFTLFHFGFELIKIAILAAIYALVIFLLRFIFLKFKKSINSKNYKFGNVYSLIIGLLFIFSFTYYGDHGLGDEANIPLGHGQIMQCSDEFAYFVPDGATNQIHIDSFLVKR